jgi:hypothetical protein
MVKWGTGADTGFEIQLSSARLILPDAPGQVSFGEAAMREREKFKRSEA